MIETSKRKRSNGLKCRITAHLLWKRRVWVLKPSPPQVVEHCDQRDHSVVEHMSSGRKSAGAEE